MEIIPIINLTRYLMIKTDINKVVVNEDVDLKPEN